MNKLKLLAISCYVTSLLTLGVALITVMLGIPYIDPTIAIMFFLFFQELSKLTLVSGELRG